MCAIQNIFVTYLVLVTHKNVNWIHYIGSLITKKADTNAGTSFNKRQLSTYLAHPCRKFCIGFENDYYCMLTFL